MKNWKWYKWAAFVILVLVLIFAAIDFHNWSW